jgi:hypothetical protein
MIPFGFSSIEASLFTWEYVSPFDEIPDMRVVYRVFEREFRNHFRLLHLVSFNSGEQCCSRYLVVMPEKPLPHARRRLLPRQIAFLAAADRAIRMQKKVLNHSGNFLCYAAENEKFKVIVFFEGRLCHWSESELKEPSVENIKSELERFRRFLKTDSLFSRAEVFAEVYVESINRSDLRKAARDPLWRNVDLRMKSKVKARMVKGWCVLAILILLALGKMMNVALQESGAEIPDVAPVALEEPPAWSESTEPVAKVDVLPINAGAKTPRCVLPNFKMKGVIAAKLMIIEVAGASSTVLLNDSLGTFKVYSIGRDGVDLVCGDSLVHRGVEPCCR